jgi:hypothetical protein
MRRVKLQAEGRLLVPRIRFKAITVSLVDKFGTQISVCTRSKMMMSKEDYMKEAFKQVSHTCEMHA